MSKANSHLLLQGIIVDLVYALSGKLCVTVRSISGFSALLWVPNGVGLAALVLLNSF